MAHCNTQKWGKTILCLQKWKRKLEEEIGVEDVYAVGREHTAEECWGVIMQDFVKYAKKPKKLWEFRTRGESKTCGLERTFCDLVENGDRQAPVRSLWQRPRPQVDWPSLDEEGLWKPGSALVYPHFSTGTQHGSLLNQFLLNSEPVWSKVQKTQRVVQIF